MKKTIVLIKMIFTCGLFMILLGLIIIRENDIRTIINTYITPNNKITLEKKNKYYRDYDFALVQNTDNFKPNNYQDLLNIFYTVINSGNTSFTFYCPKEYNNCIKDIETIANNQYLLSDINNYVHPFNGFSHIETDYDSLRKININLIKSYTIEEINAIEEKINELYPLLVNDNKSIEENILSVHDYIINNTKYDSERSNNNIVTYQSDIAYGPLFEGYAICGGYTDLMELFLERMNVKSFKISSENHVWNAVYLNNKWYHLDLTWDDPVASNGKDYLEHNYFLIDTNKLLSMEVEQHQFNKEIYKEFAE